MEATPDPRLFEDLDQILTGAADKLAAEAHEAAIVSTAGVFGMTRRQAAITLDGANRSIAAAASQHGMTAEEFGPHLLPLTRAMIVGYTAGAVAQHDIDAGLDPETGEPRP